MDNQALNNIEMKNFFKLVFSIFLISALACTNWSFKVTPDETSSSINISDNGMLKDSSFNNYWYADKAEIRTYNLIQARYGELHKGTATVIFVAQPFLKNKGVKPSSYENTKDHIPVLKMNLLKKFGTGIYPYSMMLSTFTPLEEKIGMTKATVSGQEWCGQIFSQMNQKKNHYDVVSYSYFEEEGDRQFTLPTVLTEDEIWSRIRLDYQNLPQGEIEIIPGLYYTRLEQHEFKKEKAKAVLKPGTIETKYSIHYPARNRTIAFTFNTAFPHEIIKWEETYADKRAPDITLTTTATLDQSKNIDYWNYNAEKYKSIRRELGVPY